jgi:hypothetical protein
MGVKGFGVGRGLGLYARHRLDLWPRDVFFGVRSCCRPWRRDRLESEVLGLCSIEDDGLVCYSVRSGWDLWLGARGLRAGDEVLVSAVTHPDMARIIRWHGLCAVPVDIDPRTLAPRPGMLEAALTPRTRVVLVAHLFGGRMDLGPVARFAREHGLTLVEDCAQAFRVPEQVRDPAADVSMYSFGTLKTSTALGRAVLRVRDCEVLSRMRDLQAAYPVQRRGTYVKKLLKALVLLNALRYLPDTVRLRRLRLRDVPLPGAAHRKLHSRPDGSTVDHLLRLYGGEVERVLAYGDEFPNGLEQVAPGAPDIWAQVYHANRDEWSVTVDDIIYRRTTLGIRGFDTPEVRQKIVAFCPTVAGYRRP